MASNAESQGKATHAVTVIRADGSREVASERVLNAEESQTLFEMIQTQVKEESDGR